MNALAPAASILDSVGVAPERAREILGEALAGADDGELFLEKTESESLVFDDGRLKGASYDAVEGFGLRVVAGETAGYAHANEISAAAIRRAADTMKRLPDMSFEAAAAFTESQIALTSATEDAKEGVRAFMEKREPVFQGR